MDKPKRKLIKFLESILFGFGLSKLGKDGDINYHIKCLLKKYHDYDLCIFMDLNSIVDLTTCSGIMGIFLRFEKFNSLNSISKKICVLFILSLCGVSVNYSQTIHSNNYNVNQGLSQSSVTCLIKDSRGFLWLGTQDGLNRFDGYESKTFKHQTSDNNSLSHNYVNYIIESKKGHLWIATNYGLNRCDPVDGDFKVFLADSSSKSSPENQMFKRYQDDHGFIWVKTGGYLTRYVPESVEFQCYKHFTDDLSYFDPSGNNLITIEFASLDIMQPSKNKYAYKLGGVENEWVDIGTRRHATFSNLSSGEYIFKVRGSNHDYIWNEEETRLFITAKTPFWCEDIAFFIYGVLGLTLIFLIIHYRTLRLKRSNQQLKERERIAQQVVRQKEELSIKNKNITDSLLYAKRIQEALLPSEKILEDLLNDSFLLYKPKDIVSGDFYWINEKGSKLFLAVVDCTGHGVPGAFMSIIGVELFDSIINDQGITEAENILYEMNKGILSALSKEGERNRSIRDGMDIALCVIDKKNKELEFAGAFRPLYLLNDNKIEEIKGARFSVGLREDLTDPRQIPKKKFSLTGYDMIYLFTDGYADQFGGPEGKKYKYRRFRHLLLNIHKFPVKQQQYYLNKSIEDWMGNQEQIDDILIVGFNPRSLIE